MCDTMDIPAAGFGKPVQIDAQFGDFLFRRHALAPAGRQRLADALSRLDRALADLGKLLGLGRKAHSRYAQGADRFIAAVANDHADASDQFVDLAVVDGISLSPHPRQFLPEFGQGSRSYWQ